MDKNNLASAVEIRRIARATNRLAYRIRRDNPELWAKVVQRAEENRKREAENG